MKKVKAKLGHLRREVTGLGLEARENCYAEIAELQAKMDLHLEQKKLQDTVDPQKKESMQQTIDRLKSSLCLHGARKWFLSLALQIQVSTPRTREQQDNTSSPTLTPYSDAALSEPNPKSEYELEVTLRKQYEQQIYPMLTTLTQLYESYKGLDGKRVKAEEESKKRWAENCESNANMKLQVEREIEGRIRNDYSFHKRRLEEENKVNLDKANSLVKAEKAEKERLTREATQRITDLEAQVQQAQSRAEQAESDLSRFKNDAELQYGQLQQQFTTAQTDKANAENQLARYADDVRTANADRDAALAELERVNANAIVMVNAHTTGAQLADTSHAEMETNLNTIQDHIRSASQRIGVSADNFLQESCSLVEALQSENTTLKNQQASIQAAWDGEKDSLAIAHQSEIDSMRASIQASFDIEKADLVSSHQTEIQSLREQHAAAPKKKNEDVAHSPVEVDSASVHDLHAQQAALDRQAAAVRERERAIEKLIHELELEKSNLEAKENNTKLGNDHKPCAEKFQRCKASIESNYKIEIQSLKAQLSLAESTNNLSLEEMAVQEQLVAIHDRELAIEEREKEMRSWILYAEEKRVRSEAEANAEFQRSAAEIKRLELRLKIFEALPEPAGVASDGLSSQEFASERKALEMALTDHHEIQRRIKSNPAAQDMESFTLIRDSLEAINEAAEQLNKVVAHARRHLPNPHFRVWPSTAVSRRRRRPRSTKTDLPAVVPAEQPSRVETSTATDQSVRAVVQSVPTTTMDQSSQTPEGWVTSSLAESCLPFRVAVAAATASDELVADPVVAASPASDDDVSPSPPVVVSAPVVKCKWPTSKVFWMVLSCLGLFLTYIIWKPARIMTKMAYESILYNLKAGLRINIDADVDDGAPGVAGPLAEFTAILPPGLLREDLEAWIRENDSKLKQSVLWVLLLGIFLFHKLDYLW